MSRYAFHFPVKSLKDIVWEQIGGYIFAKRCENDYTWSYPQSQWRTKRAVKISVLEEKKTSRRSPLELLQFKSMMFELRRVLRVLPVGTDRLFSDHVFSRHAVVVLFGQQRRSGLYVLHEGFFRLLSEISQFGDLPTADGELAAMMYDCIENGEKSDERVQIVVEEFLGRRQSRVERTKGPSVDSKLVQNAEWGKQRGKVNSFVAVAS